MGALAGCGGSGGVGSTPTPTPTPPPAPTYTPIASLTGNQSFQTGGLAFANGQANTVVTSRPYGSGIRLDYIAATDSYTLTSPEGSSVSINASNIVTAQSTNTQTFYDKSNGTTRDLVVLTRPAVNGVALSYTMLGSWSHLENMAGPINLAVGGVPTVASDMPRTGTADYDVTVAGSVLLQSSVPVTVTGQSTGTLSVNFAAGTLATSMTLRGTQPGTGITVDFGTASATGTLTSGGPGFTGTFSGTFTGQLSGGFFGPQALEAGYAWTISGNGLDGRGMNVARKR